MSRRGISCNIRLITFKSFKKTEDKNQLTYIPTTIYIEPPVAGEDDAEDESGGITDDVCPSQLNGECEVVLDSGRHFQNFDEEDEIEAPNIKDLPVIMYDDIYQGTRLCKLQPKPLSFALP